MLFTSQHLSHTLLRVTKYWTTNRDCVLPHFFSFFFFSLFFLPIANYFLFYSLELGLKPKSWKKDFTRFSRLSLKNRTSKQWVPE